MADTKCPTCKGVWSTSKGPGRQVGPVANSLLGVMAPLPDDFEYEFCQNCKTRNLTPELRDRFLAVEKKYLEARNAKPVRVKKKAIDVTPYFHGTVRGVPGQTETLSATFVDEIVQRSWSEDGSKIIFMRDNHTFFDALPDEEVSVVLMEPPAEYVERYEKKDAEWMAKRPVGPQQRSKYLVKLLMDLFSWYESHDLCVGILYLHQNEIALLEQEPTHYEKIQVPGGFRDTAGDVVGLGWFHGANVRTSPEVLPGHVAIIQEDVVVSQIGRGACMCLGADYLGLKKGPGQRLEARA